MAPDGIGHVRYDAFLVVYDSVAVGIGPRRAGRPRIEDGIPRLRRLERHSDGVARGCRLASEESGVGRVYPLVVPCVERRTRVERIVGHPILGGDYVARLQSDPRRLGGVRGARAENRVEAVVEFVEVVHSVAVGVGEARIGRGVSADGRCNGDHRAGYRPHVYRIADLVARDGAVPAAARRGEVAEAAPAVLVPRVLERASARCDVLRGECRSGSEALLLRGVVYLVRLDLARVGVDDPHDLPDAGRDSLVVYEAPAIPRLGRVGGGRSRVRRVEHWEARARSVRLTLRVAEALRMRGHDPLGRRIVLAFLELAAHEGRRDVVVAEVADRLDEVLLVVLEPVMVEVDVAARTEQAVVREAELWVFEVVEDCVALPCRVHAARDVDAVAERDAGVYSVGYERRLVELDVLYVASARSDDGKIREAHGHARVLHLPSVGDSVEVGVDRARVHAAAAEADGEPVVLGAAVYEPELGRPLVVGVGEHDAPHAALDAVGDSVEVGVGSVGVSAAGEDQQGEAVAEALHRSRIRREELVPPALGNAGMVAVDGFAVLVDFAGINAGVLVGPCELVAVEVERQRLPKPVFVIRDRRSVRVAVHVEFPAVRDSVLVGVRAVRQDRREARLLRELRELLRDRRGGRRVCRRSGVRRVRGCRCVVCRRRLVGDVVRIRGLAR